MVSLLALAVGRLAGRLPPNAAQAPAIAPKRAMAVHRQRGWLDLAPVGMKKILLVAAFVALEVLAALYLSILAFDLSGWLVSDHVALEMSDADWLLAGCVRFAEWCLVAAVFSVVLAWMHRRLGVAAGSRIFRWLPFAWFMLIRIASGFGASKLVVERPYM